MPASLSSVALRPGQAYLPEVEDPPPPESGFGPLSVAIAVSLVLHSFALLVTFQFPDRKAFDRGQTLEVVLVNAKSARKPINADALAQHNLDGGGNTELERRARSNLPVLPDMPSDADIAVAAKRVEQLEQEAQQLLTRLKAGDSWTDIRTRPQQQTERTDAPNAADVAARRTEIARLEAQIAKEWDAYQKLPRRKFVGARTESVVYAEYVDDWRQRVEKIGTENFPEEARRRGIYGTLLLSVAIRADGSVESVEVERSSGSRILDAAAERIVHLAAPFKPLPAAVRRQTDILHITRNWSFTRSDQLVSE